MPAKGTTNNPHGRPKGVPNKSTNLAREAIARFIDDNSERLQGWLDEIASKDPQAAFNCVRDLLEYHLPKIARTEIANPDGENFRIQTDVTKAILAEIPAETLEKLINDAKDNA